MTKITPTIHANGFAVQPVAPVLPAHKRLLADGFLVDTDDGIRWYAKTDDVEQHHIIAETGEWIDVIGIYQIKGGVLTACDVEGWARDEQQALRDDATDAAYRSSLKYD